MADVAHEAPGLALPKPGDIAPHQASRPKLRVFISYSRDDLKFADQLDAALKACGFECSIDREGISGGEDWKRRLGNLISDAGTVVFVLSSSSARSEICVWEVGGGAARLNKRIFPVNCRPLEGRESAAAPTGPELHLFLRGPEGIRFGLRLGPREAGSGSQHRL